MILKILAQRFSVCKIKSIDQADFTGEHVFLAKTVDEISLVCEADCVPINVQAREDGWKALKIIGILEFDMIGVISKISSILANVKISVFVVSTYNTDYILLKEVDLNQAVDALNKNGFCTE